MEEIDFPRGGTEHKRSISDLISTKSEPRQSRKRSKDFLFGSSKSGKRSKKRNNKTDSTEVDVSASSINSVLPVGGGGVSQSLTKGPSNENVTFIEPLSFQKLAKGTKLLGMIREVAPEYAVVSLPSMLTGFVRRDPDFGFELQQVVSVGMVLPVVVLRASADTSLNASKKPVVKRRIELSISPVLLNNGLSGEALYVNMTIRGRIRSVEDHGCLVDLNVQGIGSNGCFLKFENIEGGYVIVDSGAGRKFDNMDVSDKRNEFKLNKGRIYDFTILSLPSKTSAMSSSKIIQLRLETQKTRSERVTESTSDISTKNESFLAQHTIRTICPGMLCSVSVEHFARNGLCVTFLGNIFRGAISHGNFGVCYPDKGENRRFGISNKHNDPCEMWWNRLFVGNLRSFHARIIAVDPVTKIIRLSLIPHILSLVIPSSDDLPAPGTIIENAKVVRLDHNHGALLALPSRSDIVDDGVTDTMDSSAEVNTCLMSNEIYRKASNVKCAYVHISKAIDNTDGRTSESKFNKKFSLNATIPKLRILSVTNWVDNVASCATADSIVSSAVLTHSDLQPGAIYKSVPIVANLDCGGILVKLSGIGLKGIVPSMHLFDTATIVGNDKNSYRNKIRKEKFKVGNKIDVKCLMTEPLEKKCLLTAKRALLEDPLDAIVDYEKIVSGKLATGFINKASKDGLMITFYNNVFGRVKARRLAEELGVEDPTVDYRVGDVVKVRIVKCTEHKMPGRFLYHLDLSLDLSVLAEESGSYENRMDMELRVGLVLPRKSMKVVDLIPSCLNHNIKTGHAVVCIKKKKLLLSYHGENVDNKQKGSIYCKLPFEHLLDSFEPNLVASAKAMDELAHQTLRIGKKIAQEGLVLQVPKMGSGAGALPIVSLKSQLIENMKQNSLVEHETAVASKACKVIVPSPSTALFMGALVHGYCARLDSRYGAFIRFLDNTTGLVPKLKGGLNIALFSTVVCKIIALDVTASEAPRILLKPMKSKKMQRSEVEKKRLEMISASIKVGDQLGKVIVDDICFNRACVSIFHENLKEIAVKASIHMTMADPINGILKFMPLTEQTDDTNNSDDKQNINEHHPFFTWKVGDIIKETTCVANFIKDGVFYLELSNRTFNEDQLNGSQNTPPVFVKKASNLKVGDTVSGIITHFSKENNGFSVQISPGVSGHVPGVELNSNPDVLNELKRYYKIGGRIKCIIIKNQHCNSNVERGVLQLSALPCNKGNRDKPLKGSIVIGRVNRVVMQRNLPALMLNLPGGYLGRCDITELDDVENWSNFPLGRDNAKSRQHLSETEHIGIVKKKNSHTFNNNLKVGSVSLKRGKDEGGYVHGLFVRCCILSSSSMMENSFSDMVDVSLRKSRIAGDLSEDVIPVKNDIVQAYVVDTNNKGCFLRLSQLIEGRVILKDLSDIFISDVSIFQCGKLVTVKVLGVKEKNNRKFCDLTMRESHLVEDESKLKLEDIKVGHKYSGVVSNVESYGVFVRLSNSEVIGLTHVSECSDDYIKNLLTLYEPGDLVKVLVIKVLKNQRKISFSMKASHFDDDDSDIASSDNDEEDDIDKMNIELLEKPHEAPSKMKVDKNETLEVIKNEMGSDPDVAKNDSDSESSDESTEANSIDEGRQTMDTDVGFDFSLGTEDASEDRRVSTSIRSDSSTSSGDSDTEEENHTKSTHKSRKKAVGKKLEEKMISEIEQRMADGLEPEKTIDFERLLASDPNSSENWMKYMAYHLSLADIESARNVANRAFDRIEFREEGEKLNVWTALIALESKYGTSKSLNDTLSRASQHNNPKQVYLRTCEMLEKQIDTAEENKKAIDQADEMFTKMCKKFKSKKSVWIAYFRYLLKSCKNDEAHELHKRCLISLPTYKHVETMSKFAQLEYEYGSTEWARTIFDAVLDKSPKRIDLLFVYIDKEIKHGDIDVARRLFHKRLHPADGKSKVRYNDKQMKSLFKKWYRMEDLHGDDQSRMNVKMAAKTYVEHSSAN